MKIKQLLEELDKYNINEFANSNECGLEVTEDMMKECPDLDYHEIQDRVKYLIYKIEHCKDITNLQGLKVSNVATHTWHNPNTHETKTYNISICLGKTNKENIVQKNSGYGLYHMKFGKKQHWGLSKDCLNNIHWLQDGTVKEIKTGLNTFDNTKFDVVFGKQLYGIALEYNAYNNETTLITCYKKTKRH